MADPSKEEEVFAETSTAKPQETSPAKEFEQKTASITEIETKISFISKESGSTKLLVMKDADSIKSLKAVESKSFLMELEPKKSLNKTESNNLLMEIESKNLLSAKDVRGKEPPIAQEVESKISESSREVEIIETYPTKGVEIKSTHSTVGEIQAGTDETSVVKEDIQAGTEETSVVKEYIQAGTEETSAVKEDIEAGTEETSVVKEVVDVNNQLLEDSGGEEVSSDGVEARGEVKYWISRYLCQII